MICIRRPRVPFVTVGDTLRNRRFAMNFPATIILGLEEQIDGTLLEYLNSLGAVTMGFEAGQHVANLQWDMTRPSIWIATWLLLAICALKTCPD